MMSQANLGNATTIINNTARSLAQNEALVGWDETRRLVLNAMKPNKQSHIFSRLVQSKAKPNKPFKKHQVQSILFMMVMCWASQSSAQPTRANQSLIELADNQDLSSYGLNKEEMDMFDFVFVEAHTVNTFIAQADVQKTVLVEKNRNHEFYATVEACIALPANQLGTLDTQIMTINQFASNIFSITLDKPDADIDKVSILRKPAHGTLSADYVYTPDKGFIGNDRAEVLVEIGEYKIKVVGSYKVVPEKSFTKYGFFKYCQSPGWHQISSVDRGLSLDTQVANISAGIYTKAPSPLLSNYSNTVYPSLTYSFTNLPGTAVGQTTGSGTAANILLDTNAAGRGWFMDSTPLSNDEYLPTSNPNEWIAKADSTAADKMDLLSVLLHEYGHALGFEHSSDPHDFMGTNLTAGVRRLPTADEMQWG